MSNDFYVSNNKSLLNYGARTRDVSNCSTSELVHEVITNY